MNTMRTRYTHTGEVTEFRKWAERVFHRPEGSLIHDGATSRDRKDATRRTVTVAAAYDMFKATAEQLADEFGYSTKSGVAQAVMNCAKSGGRPQFHDWKESLKSAWKVRRV